MTEHPAVTTLRERHQQLRRELVSAFQEAEQAVLDLTGEVARAGPNAQDPARLDLSQATMFRNHFLRLWQEMTKEETR